MSLVTTTTRAATKNTHAVVEEQAQLSTIGRMRSFIGNLFMSRAKLSRLFGGETGNRDIDKECGYPGTEELDEEAYRDMYDRLGLAARVVGVYPDECWALNPEIVETEEESDLTEFEGACKELDKRVHLHHYLHKIDVESGIGNYGILFLGFSDGEGLDKPVGGWDGKKPLKEGAADLLYMRTYDQTLVKISQWEEDASNPRYGLPTLYDITTFDPRTTRIGGAGQKNTSKQVHWTRCIHVADGSETFARPRLQQVYNFCLDYKKTLGGAAEMFWNGGFPGVAFETYPEMGEVEIDRESLDKEMGEYYDRMKRWFATRGMTSKVMSSTVASPEYHVRCQIEAVCMAIGVPMRIFIGSEEAKLSSTQDARTWHKRLHRRQATYLTPRLVQPVVDRLIAVGALPRPKQYTIAWPDLNTPTDEDRANVASKLTEALALYVSSGVDQFVEPVDYLHYFQGLPLARAKMMVDKSMKRIGKESTFADDDVARQPKPVKAPPVKK